MDKKWLNWALLILLVVGFLLGTTALSRAGAGISLSPDETANAVAAERFVTHGDMSVERDGEWMRAFPWIRPRSFVTQGDRIVPVGFLGWPFLVGLWRAMSPSWAIGWLTPLLAVSLIYPLWRFTEGWRRGARWATLLAWCSFPTVVIYAARGLFPNLPQVCLMLWASYLSWRDDGRARWNVAAGFLVGAALSIRPSEALWICAWLAGAWYLRRGQVPRLAQVGWYALAAMVPMVISALIARATYGGWAQVGYLLRDTVVQASTEMAVEPTSPGRIIDRWPFGFHPMHVLFNVREYLVYFLAPWSFACALAVVFAWRNKHGRVLVVLGSLTGAVVALMYGQAVYQDHVGVNVVSLGNSFLRYALPLAPFVAMAVGYACERLYARRPQVATAVVLAIGVWTLASYGIWTATLRDREGIVDGAAELRRYAELRAEARRLLPPGAVILSERSDKVFFPVFDVATPMPGFEEIERLLSTLRERERANGQRVEVYYFGSALDGKALGMWTRRGLTLDEVLRSRGQVLYHIRLTPPLAA